MAKRSSRGGPPRFLRHRNLIAAEALLLANMMKDLINETIEAQPTSVLPNWGKVLFIMAATVGVLGFFFALLERLTVGGVAKTHDVVRALPLPAPMLAVHGAAFVGLFYLYAHFLRLPVWPLAG